MSVYNARHHTLILLKDFMEILKQGIPFNQDPLEEDEASFLEQLAQLITDIENSSPDYSFNGQIWLSRLFRNFPTFSPLLGREVLWYFAGDALHFMPDEEIEKFQQLEDALAEGDENFDYLAAKIAIFNQ